MINAAGRISVDMYPYIKRDYKLPMYNLNTVGYYFIGENKTDLKANEIWEEWIRFNWQEVYCKEI